MHAAVRAAMCAAEHAAVNVAMHAAVSAAVRAAVHVDKTELATTELLHVCFTHTIVPSITFTFFFLYMIIWTPHYS